MKKAWLVLEIGFATAALALVSLFCAYAWPDKDFGLSGWVQAFGSIGAIIGAFEVSRRQAQESRMQTQEEARRLIQDRNNSIKAIVTHARDEVESVEKNYSSMPEFAFVGTFKFNPYSFGETATALSVIPLHELGSYDAVSSLAGLQSSLKRVAAAGQGIATRNMEGIAQITGPDVVELLTASKMAKYHASRYLAAIE